MKKLYEDATGFFTRDWTVSEKTLIIVCCLLLGMVRGLCFAAGKKNKKCGCIEEKEEI